MLSKAERAKIQARADAATAGPWAPALSADRKRFWVLSGSGTAAERRVAGLTDGTDAQFIAHAREDITTLLGELARIEQAFEREGLMSVLDSVMANVDQPVWEVEREALAEGVRELLTEPEPCKRCDGAGAVWNEEWANFAPCAFCGGQVHPAKPVEMLDTEDINRGIFNAWALGYSQGVTDQLLSDANIGAEGPGVRTPPNRTNPFTP